MEQLNIDLFGGFYDNLILSGTKINIRVHMLLDLFYDNLILSGTKIEKR